MPPSSKKHTLSDLSKLSKVSFADDVREYILQEGGPSRSHPLSSLSLGHSGSADSGGSMRIFVKTSRGENITLDVESFYTIDYVKAKIQEKVQISSHQHLVLTAGDQLLAEGDRNLGDYNIQNESTIQLLLQDHQPIVLENVDGKPFNTLSQLFANDFNNSDENYHYQFDPESDAIRPNSYLDILGSQDDNISVLTSTTFFTTSSDVSETNSQICLPDNFQDNVSILTPRTTNYSIAAKQNQNTGGKKPPRPRSNLKNRSPSLTAQPGGKDTQASPLPSSRTHVSRSPSQEEMAQEQPFENWDSQTRNIPSLVPTENDEQLHLPPVPLPAARNIEEETLYTAVAEARVSVDCGSTLTTNERSLFIKQGRCPTCGIQTHKRPGMFKKRSLRPLSNEHVLMGRCLICNPINIVTHQMVDISASPLNAEDETNNNDKTTDDHLDEGGQWDALPVQMDAQVLGRKTEVEKSQEADPIDQPRPPPSVPLLGEHPGSEADYDRPKLEDPTPSAPSLVYVCSESEAEDAQPKHSPKTGPRDEVEQWLLSRLPTLKERDIKKYCQFLDDDGFDSILMLDVLEEGDFGFMKKAHRRVLAKRLRSMSCIDPPSFEDT